MAKPWKRGPITCIYARGSKDTQRNSIPVQIEKCKAYIEAQKIKGVELPPLDESFEDHGVSGVKVPFLDRPESKRLLRKMQTDDVLLVTRVDRLGRNLIDILTTIELLKKRGVRMIILDFFQFELDTNTPIAVLMLQLTAAIAQFEGSIISMRTKDTLDKLRREGKRTSQHAPRGWKFDSKGNVVEDHEMRMWYGKMVQMRDGGATFPEIADYMQKIGAPKPRAAVEWNSKNVGRAVRWAIANREAAKAPEDGEAA